ncbi:MAG TPA: metalloregulator ArsR/SmtB family transcription factor [Gaiellaceae bacterium]|jgi:ArsR family transcriptional regulator|nr:metalloregulator ArsR/SmtB family transcription factor [Gaiellaceae bacterium]
MPAAASVASPLLSDSEARATAVLFRALGDPARVKILNLLATRGEPVCLCNLVEPLGLAQATVSHHLRKLVQAGLLTREERGKWSFFAIDPQACSRLAALVDFEGCC